MNFVVYFKDAYVGGVAVENDQVGWIYQGDERIGRIEVDWGSEDQEHIASAYIGGNCILTVALERYGSSIGKIYRQYEGVGEVRVERAGLGVMYHGQEPIGRIETKEEGISGKHLILFGGAGAAVLFTLQKT